jgi:hypothetical protein
MDALEADANHDLRAMLSRTGSGSSKARTAYHPAFPFGTEWPTESPVMYEQIPVLGLREF